jgi:hypothetical protein
MEDQLDLIEREIRDASRSGRDGDPLTLLDVAYLRPEALERARLEGVAAVEPREDRFLRDLAARCVNPVRARPRLRRVIGWLWVALLFVGARLQLTPPGWSDLSRFWQTVALGVLCVILLGQLLASAAAYSRRRRSN